jgi:ribose transport system ATP-binding protein
MGSPEVTSTNGSVSLRSTGVGEVILRVDGVSKTFPGTRALDDVSLEVRRGEIHALVGNNGSGKSTLIKILAGVCAADPGGTIVIRGERVEAHRFGPAKARGMGLHFVHQVPAVFPALSVAENIALGRGYETDRAARIRWRDQRERARSLIERFSIRASPDVPVGALSPVDRTLVAIARALQDQEGDREGVLVLDEPTASLPGREVERLLDTLRRYAAAGQTIVYVTHRLDEVLQASHRVSALRDGRHVGTVDTEGMDEAAIVSLMLGRAVQPSPPSGAPSLQQTPQDGAPHGRARRESGRNETHTTAMLSVRDAAGGPVTAASFDLGRGEILGIAGLIGSGAAEVLRMLFGVLPMTAGTVLLEGERYRPAGPRAAMAAGVAYVPPDRASESNFHAMSVRANVSAGGVRRYFRRLRLRHDIERADVRGSMDRFMIRAFSGEQSLSTLSGGNQQKVVLARWLRDQPKLVLLDEPTQGVDVHARDEIHGLLRQAARAGTSIIAVSSDFDELARRCDRVLVMFRGRVVGEVRPPSLSSHRLTELAHFAPEAAP